jgi:hypothetical protein
MLVVCTLVVSRASVPSVAACWAPVTVPPLMTKVTDGLPGSPLVAVTVLGPGVGPSVSTVLDVAAVSGPLVPLTCGENTSPGAELVQLTVPHGGGTVGLVQSIDTTRGLGSVVLTGPL